MADFMEKIKSIASGISSARTAKKAAASSAPAPTAEPPKKGSATVSKYPPISKPPYRGLIKILKMMDLLTEAMVMGFQKTTLAAAWYTPREAKTGGAVNMAEVKGGTRGDPFYMAEDLHAQIEAIVTNDKNLDEAIRKNPQKEREILDAREKYRLACDLNDDHGALAHLKELGKLFGFPMPSARDQEIEREEWASKQAQRRGTPEQWGKWSGTASDQNKQTASMCRIINLYNDGQMVDLGFQMQELVDRHGYVDNRARAKFIERSNEIYACSEAVYDVRNAITNNKKGALANAPENQQKRAIAEAVNGNSEFSPQNCMRKIAAELSKNAAGKQSGETVARIKSLLGFPGNFKIPMNLINRGMFDRLRQLAQSDDYAAFMEEVDNQRSALERAVVKQNEAAKGSGK